MAREWDRLFSEKQRAVYGSTREQGFRTIHGSALLNTAESPVTIASVHASKRSTTLDAKNNDEFYENLAAIIGSIPSKEQIVLLADFNARVGTYQDFWTS